MQFQKGQSGNPAGRRRGSRNEKTIRIQEMLDEQAEKLIRKAFQLAEKGNLGALRLCLDRILPARKGGPLVCETPPIDKAADAVRAIASITSAATAGDLAPDDAAKLAKVISVYVSTLEARDFEDRLTRLERADIERPIDVSSEPAFGNDAGA
jgi:hypothetical protein